MTLVSVITPTWQRHGPLMLRCVPSVQEQSWEDLEHIVVSDGPDEMLRVAPWPHPVRYSELPEHDPVRHWGHLARLHALELAQGDLIAYLDDDDHWTQHHVLQLATALEQNPRAGFAFSRTIVHARAGDVRIGDGRPAHGRLISSMVMHRRKLLDVATWEGPNPAEDWVLFEKWLLAGTEYESVDAETVHYYPSDLSGVPVTFKPVARLRRLPPPAGAVLRAGDPLPVPGDPAGPVVGAAAELPGPVAVPAAGLRVAAGLHGGG